MKKTYFLKSVCGLICSVLLLNGACVIPVRAGEVRVQGAYESFFDHSELEWYLTQNYGPSATEQYTYYDFNDGEESYLLAVKKDDGGLPMIILHAFNAGIADWYCFDNHILESSSTQISGYAQDGREIYQVTFYYNDTPMYFYVTYESEESRISQLMYMWGENEYGICNRYTYDEKGRISSFVRYDGSFYSAFFEMLPEDEYHEIYTYQYDEMDRLVKLSLEIPNQETEYSGWDIYYDENGDRYQIITEDSVIRAELIQNRDENGRVRSAVSTEYFLDGREDDTPYERTVFIEYLPGGYSTYDNGWEG